MLTEELMCDEFQEILKVLCHKPLEATRPFRIVLCTFSTGRQSLHQRVAALVLLIGGCRDGNLKKHLSTSLLCKTLQTPKHQGGGGESKSNAAYGRSEINVPQVHRSLFYMQGHYDFLKLGAFDGNCLGSGLLHAKGCAERLWRLVSSTAQSMAETRGNTSFSFSLRFAGRRPCLAELNCPSRSSALFCEYLPWT